MIQDVNLISGFSDYHSYQINSRERVSPNKNSNDEQIKKRSIESLNLRKKSSIESSPIKERKITEGSSPTKRFDSTKHSNLSPDLKGLSVKNSHNETSCAKKSLFEDFNSVGDLHNCFFDSTLDYTDNFLESDLSKEQRIFSNVVKDSQQALQNSLNTSIPMYDRLVLLPKRPDLYSASGSYITYSTGGKPALIVKPANQEAGAKDCPTGKPATISGINPGESAIREFFARKVQELLQVDLGIPPVCVTTMRHPSFGALKEIQNGLNDLKKKEIDLSIEDLFRFWPNNHDTTAIAQELLAKIRNPILRDIRSSGMTQDLEEQFILFCKENSDLDLNSFTDKLSKAFNNQNWITKARPKIIQFWTKIGKQKGVEELIQKTYNFYHENAVRNPKSFVSAQKFEENFCSLLDLSPNECKKIPTEEFHKLIIDIILFNADRHLGNILVKKEYNSPNDYVYRFILIDHGYCLPRPQCDNDCNGVKQARFEFLSFNQADHPISGGIKDAILQLNISSFIKNLKEEMLATQKEYPKYFDLCSIPDECYLLIDFNLHLLKIGVELERSLREIASFQVRPHSTYPTQYFGGEVIETLKQVVISDTFGNQTLNYELLDQLLYEIFSSNRLYADHALAISY